MAIQKTNRQNPQLVVSLQDSMRIPQRAYHNGAGWMVSGNFIRNETFQSRFRISTQEDIDDLYELDKGARSRLDGLEKLMAGEHEADKYY